MRIWRLSLLCLATPLAAQELRFDPEPIETCLFAGGVGEECVGAGAQACMAASDAGFTTAGMGYCFEQEWQWWDAALNRSYGLLRDTVRARDAASRDGSAPSQEAALQAMQRAWIAFRDARCDYERALWGGGTGAGPAALSCLMATTARQALYLEEQLGE